MSQVIDGLRLMTALKSKDAVKELDGGERIVVSLRYARNGTAGWVGEFSQLNLTPQNIITAAEFNYKMLAGTAIVTDFEKLRNMGRNQVINLAKEKINDLVESLQEQFNTKMCASDGTGSDDINGLPIIVDSAGTFGAISRTTETWWSANETAVGAALSAANMATMWNTCTRNLFHPDLLITTQTQYERYEALVQAEQQITKERSGDIGFDHLYYKGQPLFWDEQIGSGILYMLTSKHLEVGCHKDRMFDMQPVERHPFQLADIHVCTWFGNFYARCCNTQGKLTGLT